MLRFTIVNNKVVLDPNIVLLMPLSDLYVEKRGPKLLQVIYYIHSRHPDNPFRDLDQITIEENVMRAVFNKGTWKELKITAREKKLYKAAEDLFLKHNTTPESRLERAIDRKLDEVSKLLNDTDPVIEESITKSGETKFNSNLTIILNLFSKIETIMKSKKILQNSIMKQEASGKIRGGGTTSFREMGVLETKS